MRLFRPPHMRLRCDHSSSSLPLQSAPYASASTRSLRAPQHALNPFSSTPMRSYCTLHPTRFLAQSPSPPHQCALTAHVNLRAFSRAHPSAFSHLHPRAQVSSTVRFSAQLRPPSSPLASQAKSRCVQRSCLPTAAALPESKKWVCTEIASLLSRATDVPTLKQRPP